MAAHLDEDPFPKAPILPFPVESASPAITSVVDLLVAAAAAAIVIGADRSVKFVSDAAYKLFDRTHAELSDLKAVETLTRIHVGALSAPIAGSRKVAGKELTFNLVPLSGGGGGAVLLFRRAEARSDIHESFSSYVQETVLRPLKALHESLRFASRDHRDPLLSDSATAVEQILSALELAPNVEESRGESAHPTVTEIVQEVAERYHAFAELKSIRLQVDAHELSERLTDSDRLAESLSILVENALHYVPPNGQVVLGLRMMEHKERPLLLFFVMDNGPLVPEHLRQVIFESSFAWMPSAPERTGRALHRCREFAVAHGGSVWAESKTGKACTFFLRVRPDPEL